MRRATRALTAARSQESLAVANGKRDLNATLITPTSPTSIPEHSSSICDLRSSTAIKAKSRAPVCHHAVGTAHRGGNEQVMSDVVNAVRRLHTNDQIIELYRSGFLDDPSNRAISANTPTSAAPPACWIFWTPNAVIAPTNLPIARRSPATCSRSSNCAKPWEQGACHEKNSSRCKTFARDFVPYLRSCLQPSRGVLLAPDAAPNGSSLANDFFHPGETKADTANFSPCRRTKWRTCRLCPCQS